MQRNLIFVLLLLPLFSYSQPNTEVFLFDLDTNNGIFEISNMKNISNNEGYDNQPSFLDNNTILYSGTRDGQTDIAKYSINYNSKIWINRTDGSEYSPLKIPNIKAVSAIRLDKDGTQFLYKYSLRNGEAEILIDEIIIGYQVWYSENMLVSSVLEEGGLSLYVSNLQEHKNYKFDTNISRSLHNIPNTNLVSYVSKQNETWAIKSLNPISGELKSIANTIPNAEDMCWLPNGTMLMGKDNNLYTYNPKKDQDWIEVSSLKKYSISNITRLAISLDGKKLALVGEGGNNIKSDPSTKLDPKLENISWITGSWKGEVMGGITEENWSKPSGGSMMATFKLVKDGKVTFYEIEIIREIDNTLMLQLKHFNNDLKGWESKDDTVDFPLIEITTNKIVFEGMTFEKISDKEMNVYVVIHNKDGSTETLKFNYKK